MHTASLRTGLCALVAVGAIVVPATAASAATGSGRPPCATPLSTSGDSETCGLTPGDGSSTVTPANATVSYDGSHLTISTVDTGGYGGTAGQPPSSSSACLYPAPLSDHRLNQQQCTAAGGTWYTWTGSSETIAAPSTGAWAIQVEANLSAGNGNGTSFYNVFEFVPGSGTPLPVGAIGAVAGTGIIGLLFALRLRRHPKVA